MDAAYDPAAWHDFGVALVGATGALLGLVFVVVSLHLKAVVNDSVLRRRAEITLGLFATALVASAMLLIPGQRRQALGAELILIAAIYIGFSTLTTVAATRSRRGVSRDRLARFFFGELSAGLILIGGLGLVTHALGGAYLVGAGIIAAVLCSMLATWSLFVGLGLELER
jgi:modulator of FtsH protease